MVIKQITDNKYEFTFSNEDLSDLYDYSRTTETKIHDVLFDLMVQNLDYIADNITLNPGD